LALERYERLRGYPGDVQEVALALPWRYHSHQAQMSSIL
jgi:hypothetical protein